MSEEFVKFDVLPNYSAGFGFSWELSQAFTGPAPWTFYVQRGHTPTGPWEDFSPAIIDQYQWADITHLVAPKDPVLYFRVRAEIGGSELFSHVRQPYGDLDRSEFLIVQNVQRQELLNFQNRTGVGGLVWSKAVFGPRCTVCTDLVGGNPTDSRCPECFGTGRAPGYHGPYPTCLKFSPQRRNKHMPGDTKGVHEDYTFQVRMLGTPPVKKDDVLVAVASDKRYYVDKIVNVAEMRRIPIMQEVTVNEIPSSSPMYDLGAS